MRRILLALAFLLPLRAQEPPIHCPAIDHDERCHPYSPLRSSSPIVLVLKGTVERAGNPSRGPTLAVTEVLEGDRSWAGNQFSGISFEPNEVGQRLILALSYDHDGLGFIEHYRHQSWKLAKEQRILGLARLQLRTSQADLIVIGKYAAARSPSRGTLQVIESVSGKCTPGQQLRLSMSNEEPTPDDTLPFPSKKEMLFLLKSQPPANSRSEYDIIALLQPEQKSEVLAARQILADLPTIPAQGSTPAHRLVGSDLDPARAIEFLASEIGGLRILGQSRLSLQDEPTKTAIRKEIIEELLRMDGRDFKALKGMIDACHEGDWDRDRQQWIEIIIHAIETGHPPPRIHQRSPRSTYWTAESDFTGTNHSLVWLLQGFERQRAAQHFGKRLTKLAEDRDSPWGVELALAFDEGGLRDGIELNSVERRHASTAPSRFSTGLSYGMTISRNGSFLACLAYPDIKIFSLPQLELLATVPRQGAVNALAFINHDKELLAVGSAPAGSKHQIINWRTGERTLAPGFPDEQADQLEAVGERLVLIGRRSREGQPSITLWDPVEQAARWRLPDHASYGEPAWVVTGGETVLLRGPSKNRWQVIQPDGQSSPFPFDAEWIIPLGATRALLARIEGRTERIRFTEEGAILRGEHIHGLVSEPLCSSPDGKLVVSEEANPEGPWSGRDILITEVSSGAEVGRIIDPRLDADTPLTNRRPGDRPTFDAVLIPGRDRLILSSDAKPALAFNWRSGNTLSFPSGHQSEVAHAFFTSDGEQVISIGLHDETLRTWHAPDLAPLKTSRFPHRGRVLSAYATKPSRFLMRLGPDRGISTNLKHRYRVFDFPESNHPEFLLDEEVFHDSQFHWPNPEELIAVSDRRWTRLNVETGEVSANGELSDEEDWWHFTKEILSEDGSSFYRYGGGGKLNTLTLSSQILTQSETMRLGTVEADAWLDGDLQLIPGGTHAAWGGWIFERSPFRLVAKRSFPSGDILAQCFSRDGSFYAIAERQRGRAEDHDQESRKLPTWIRIHETFSGRTLHAWKASRRWVQQVSISPNGDRILVVHSDGSLELLSIPEDR